MYYIIRDGKLQDAISEAELLKRLNDSDPYYGDYPVFLSNYSRETGYGADGEYLIIEGEIIVPKPKEKITKYELWTTR